MILRLALAHAKGLGPVRARELLARLGSVEAVFAETVGSLANLGLEKTVASHLLSSENMDFAEKERHFLQTNEISFPWKWYFTRFLQIIHIISFHNFLL